MAENPFPFQGLSDKEVLRARAAHGGNALARTEHGGCWDALKHAVMEPMFLLLVAAAAIYFLVGEQHEAWFMAGAIVLVSTISLYQDQRSRRALEALEEFSAAKARAIRNNSVAELHADELVVGDLVVVNEGELVPADGQVVQANDFAVNESIGDEMARRYQIAKPVTLLNAIDPQAYLGDVIARIVAGHPQSQIDDLLPWAYAPQPLKAVA